MARKIERSCRTCAFWAKPAGKPARADYAFHCQAPVPLIGYLPDSVRVEITRSPTSRDDGKRCPAWEVVS